MRRPYINQEISIDGRQIPYPVFTAYGYLLEKEGMDSEAADSWYGNNENLYELLNQILAIKQSCYLLRHTSHSCGSLSESLFSLKEELIMKFNLLSDLTFDETWVEAQVSE